MTPVMPMKELGKWERIEAAREGASVKQWMCMRVSRGTFSVRILKMSVSASRVWTDQVSQTLTGDVLTRGLLREIACLSCRMRTLC